MKRIFIFLCAVVFVSAAVAQTVPSLMNYQGRLTDEFGASLSNGQYRLAFRLYTNTIPVANEPLIWGREYEASLIGGVFNVVLGASGGGAVAEPTAVNDLTFAFTEPNRFLELKVVRDSASNIVNRTILPRQQLLSAPYAFTASALIKEFQEALCPPGTIVAFGGAMVPDGWLRCDGTPYYATNYPKLFGAIQAAWGAGYTNGIKTADFNVPDLRGMFLRGVSGSRNDSFADPDRNSRTAIQLGGAVSNNVASVQGNKVGDHTHGGNTGNNNGSLTALAYVSDNGNTWIRHRSISEWVENDYGANGDLLSAGAGGQTRGAIVVGATSVNNANTTEPRPVNAYVHYLIKY